MKLRIGEDALRLRLDPAELSALARGERLEVAFTAPDKDGALRRFSCVLSVEELKPAAVTLKPRTLEVTIGAGDLAALRKDEHEGVYFTQSAGGQLLEVSIEKDRRDFAPGARRRAKPGEPKDSPTARAADASRKDRVDFSGD